MKITHKYQYHTNYIYQAIWDHMMDAGGDGDGLVICENPTKIKEEFKEYHKNNKYFQEFDEVGNSFTKREETILFVKPKDYQYSKFWYNIWTIEE